MYYPVRIIVSSIRKALEIPPNKLRKRREKQTEQFVSFISTFNPNNPPIYNTIKSSVGVLKRDNVPGSENINLINYKYLMLENY